MLISISYSVQFPSTGRAFRNHIEFEPGLTAIVGKNESGKSLVIEMISYCLFGKVALRGAAAEYKTLDAALVLDVAGKRLVIHRQPKSETLSVDGVEVAVGAEALNKTIPKLLGFGYEVFNIALAAQQDQLNDLTQMKPTARAKMIDELSGMESLEATEKDCKAQAKHLSTVATAIASQLTPPVEPVKPEDYRPADEIGAEIEALRGQQALRETALRVSAPIAPIEPERPDIDLSEGQLHDYEIARDRLAQQKLSLERELARIPETTVSSATLAKAIAYAEWSDECRRRGPRPIHDADTLREWQKVWTAPGSGECPNCGYDFAAHRIQVPPLTLKEVNEELARVARWSDHPFDTTLDPVVLDNLTQEKVAHEQKEHRENLRHQLDGLTVPLSRAADLQRVRAYNDEYARYDERRTRYEADQAAFEKAQADLAQLPDVVQEIKELEEHHRACVLYEYRLERYEQDKVLFDEGMDKVRQNEADAEGFLRGAKAVKQARLHAKQQLTPRLSLAASGLLYSLTDGERQNVVIDEDFNVWVDGQPLSTLSGSGKAVVNLALRIGLGQVLTAKVLSLFIGDEIDGSMDKLRSTATHSTFANLTRHLSQVILITHKDIEADHVISL